MLHVKSTDDVVELNCICVSGTALDLPKSYCHGISIGYIKMYLVIQQVFLECLLCPSSVLRSGDTV